MNNLLQGVNIYLIGMMGAGKSTIGQHLAEKLEYRFVDTDTTIETIAKTTITDIFATEGEPYFRELESKVLSELSVYTRCVIATGGGIVQKQINWSYLRHGLIIWLNPDLEILQKRLAEDRTRPLASKLETLLTTRRPLYAQADLTIDINNEESPEDITNRIIDLIPTVLKSQV
ncbi:MAG: shikimate kinase [Pleurocapsa sp.]